MIIGLILALFIGGTFGFHYIEGLPWFTAFYATLMSVSTTGADPLNGLSPPGRAVSATVILLGICVVSFAIGTLTQAVIELELGTFFGRRRMEKEIAGLRDHIIICGAGRVGRRIAQEVAARGMPLVIIDNEAKRVQWAKSKNIPIIMGDASSEEILKQAHIDQARGLASAVTSDAQNVYIVLTARGLAPKLTIVARASEDDAEKKLLTAGATTVISPYNYAGQRMARTITSPNVHHFIDVALSSFGNGGLNLQIEEVEVSDKCELSGKSLAKADIRQMLGVIILAIRHADGHLLFNPGPEDKISPGDFLIAMGESQKLKELEKLAGCKS
ncbi:MAG: hypothetical protein A3F68_06440 [Acidobacteria bacterium RIFCSPLOWO2_12_FULL_54_10]|nr:MAG: hypothetical protein A3F68_06440 [Acidobacteria bacterium RIFCSPLOWO2_12_FULL_54_10]